MPHREHIIISIVYVCVRRRTNSKCTEQQSRAQSRFSPAAVETSAIIGTFVLRYHSPSLPRRSASLVRDLNLISPCTSTSLLLLSHKGPITALSCCIRSEKEKSSLDLGCTLVHVRREEKNNNELFTTFISGFIQGNSIPWMAHLPI